VRGTDTATIRGQVQAARVRQAARQGAGMVNAELSGKQLDAVAAMDEQAQTMLGQVMTEMKLSARAYDKIRRVSRTIADLEGSQHVKGEHVAEAVQYRVLDRAM
jgi:magnesium chelatase family protein